MTRDQSILVPLALVCAGCAATLQGVPETEPHGVIRFAATEARASDDRVTMRIDGKKADSGPGNALRVTPGAHELVFEVVRTRTETHEFSPPRIGFGSPPDDGVDIELDPETGGITSDFSSPLSGSGGFGITPIRRIRSRSEHRVTSLVTNRVQVREGWEYLVDEFAVRERPLPSLPLPRSTSFPSPFPFARRP